LPLKYDCLGIVGFKRVFIDEVGSEIRAVLATEFLHPEHLAAWVGWSAIMGTGSTWFIITKEKEVTSVHASGIGSQRCSLLTTARNHSMKTS